MQNNADVKQINRTRIYRAIYQSSEISKQELAYSLQLSLPTVLQNIKYLQEQGLIQEQGQFVSTGGRKAAKLVPVVDVRTAFGLEITKHYVNLVLTDMVGNLLYHERIYEGFQLDRRYFEQLGRLVNAFLRESGMESERILGCGIALPGVIDSESRLLVSSQALGLSNQHLDQFSQFIAYPCLFINDANAAGMIEQRFMEQQPLVVYVSLNDTVGGSIFIDGGLYQGNTFRSGEYGHMLLYPGGTPCYCGKSGCVDAYCSARTLAKESDGRLDIFFERLEGHDPHIRAVWDRYLDDLALFVDNLHRTLDCNIILGGYVGGYLDGAYLSAFLSKAARANAFGSTEYIKVCRFQTKAAALGAALLQVDRFIDTI